MKYIITLIAVFSFVLAFGQVCGGLTSINYNGHTYELVEIGSQCWFKENLQTTTYKDGTPIVYPDTDNAAWKSNTSGAYSWHDNDSITYASTYGALYNWYAVDNSAGLCPTGWHLPSDAEWTNLTDYLGGINVAGGAMKDTTLWDSPNTGANNSSGFSAHANGYRTSNGSYVFVGQYGCWWSSTQNSTTYAWYRYLSNDDSLVVSWLGNKSIGYSVRCLKDTGSIQTSMNEYDILNINIYPNPFKTHTTIELPSEPHTLTIYNIVGNKVTEEQASGTTLIKARDLTKGIYLLKIKSENHTYSGKLVVQ